jgi:hypothetical protein
MGAYAGPDVVESGLVLALDAANPKSYPGSGTTWTDLSGNGNNGTINGSPTFTNGYFSITGDTTYVSIPNSGLVPRTNNFTYSCWIYFNSVDSYDTIFENGSWTDTLLFRYESTQFTVYAEGDLRGTISWTATTGVWVNIVLRRLSNTVSCFINNTSVGTPFTMSTDINLANPNLWLMRSQHTTGQFTNGRISVFSIYNRALTAAEISQNFNALKSRFIQDGSSADRAAPSASHLVSLGITTDGVYWIDLPTAGPTQIYCILNPAYDGGGWMMAMKATTGTTFNYSANYWTTANTLNPTETNRNNGDAKFNSMNHFQSKDMMAIWPDISNGGSIPSSTLGWTWLQNNFNDGTRITPISFFGITYPTMNAGGSGKFIQDAKTYSGWASGVFSSQVDIRFYGFNYTNNPTYGLSMKCRWGFGWNENGEGLYPGADVGGVKGSNDVTGGIGLDTGGGSYSAGDRINCCQDTTGINRSARVEVYVR